MQQPGRYLENKLDSSPVDLPRAELVPSFSMCVLFSHVKLQGSLNRRNWIFVVLYSRVNLRSLSYVFSGRLVQSFHALPLVSFIASPVFNSFESSRTLCPNNSLQQIALKFSNQVLKLP
jgi:hypothetical protein